jgi:prepilin-type N-terminal cleavage/methylation domain-containing protein
MKSEIENRRSGLGFTLIELLVVITIIVVLLALLTPALDTAIYQAELAACGAHLKAIATGAQMYAGSNRREYPYRPTVREKANETHQIVDTSGQDDRPYFRDYIDLGLLLDPLCDSPVRYAEALPATNVFLPYDLWFSVKFAGNASMYRLGDRWGWDGRRFRVLASDNDGLRIEGDNARCAHPDAAGVLRFGYTINGDDGPFSGVNTGARWAGSPWRRGPVDLNYAYDDGSVLRLLDVMYAKAGDPDEDNRIVGVPHYTDGNPPPGNEQYWNQVPRQ